jgi:hypothetical protein
MWSKRKVGSFRSQGIRFADVLAPLLGDILPSWRSTSSCFRSFGCKFIAADMMQNIRQSTRGEAGRVRAAIQQTFASCKNSGANEMEIW